MNTNESISTGLLMISRGFIKLLVVLVVIDVVGHISKDPANQTVSVAKDNNGTTFHVLFQLYLLAAGATSE
ncbi:hypothetical protein BWQ96_07023 [Gracilariopsis chorda]|uniref:Uncharacterized protein n=1 Tax=Gracilariopsis chorda TaxID=448386 RepID=A0A2V3IQ44_9FLOR|nr:hypothetical protein BWQ96_07023 [Gracilariopsis chorda]|eukprot:PXF43250.1 hypothetical protein BWQ96_07023 [Gracilariopsis chorda]